MRAWGKRLHSASATVGVSDSAPKTKTRRSGRCCWSKSASSSCWRTKEGVDAQAWQALSDYGQALGVAFQVVDDILDFTGSDQQLGKPAASDLASGYLTAPTFYALEEHPSLQPLIDRQFSEPGDLDKALEMVRASKAIERTRELAETFARESRESIAWLPESAAQRALMELPDFVLSRLY